jgi:cation diffusion facilitator CzcD-associated flavoprotein CzcO
MEARHLDVLIVGAGLSGSGAALLRHRRVDESVEFVR